MFAGMMAPFGDMSGGSVFLLVLLNNVFASLVMLLSGLLAGVVPVVSVGLNGFVMGLICRHLSATAGFGAVAMDLAPPRGLRDPRRFSSSPRTACGSGSGRSGGSTGRRRGRSPTC